MIVCWYIFKVTYLFMGSQPWKLKSWFLTPYRCIRLYIIVNYSYKIVEKTISYQLIKKKSYTVLQMFILLGRQDVDSFHNLIIPVIFLKGVNRNKILLLVHPVISIIHHLLHITRKRYPLCELTLCFNKCMHNPNSHKYFAWERPSWIYL